MKENDCDELMHIYQYDTYNTILTCTIQDGKDCTRQDRSAMYGRHEASETRRRHVWPKIDEMFLPLVSECVGVWKACGSLYCSKPPVLHHVNKCKCNRRPHLHPDNSSPKTPHTRLSATHHSSLIHIRADIACATPSSATPHSSGDNIRLGSHK